MTKLTAHIHPGLPQELQAGVEPYGNGEDGYSLVFGSGIRLGLPMQDGPIKDSADVNGWTNEALIAVLVHRLNLLNQGEYRCRENSCAITHLEEALHWLHARTSARLARGVEGTHKA